MLQLESYFFPVVEVRANPDFVGSFFNLNGLLVKFMPSAYEDGTFGVNLNIILSSTTDDVPYDIHLLAYGHFKFDGDDEPQAKAVRASMNGVNLLYTAAREFLLSITSRAPFGGLVLPTRIFTHSDLLDDDDHVELLSPKQISKPQKKTTSKKKTIKK